MNLKLILMPLSCTLLFACNTTSTSETSGNIQHDTAVSIVTGIIKKDNIIKDGEYIKHYKNGGIQMRGIMKNGKRDGVWKSWYENGSNWSETTFKDGKKDGPTITWFENEKKRYEGFYTNDKESGKWVFWDEKGKQINSKDYSLE